MSLIKTERLSVHHGPNPVLTDVDFEIDRGEIVTVIGPNGSGKSTLIRSLLGILPASGGSVTRAKGLRIGYVPQKLSIDGNLPMTVRRFLSLPHKVSDRDARLALGKTGVPDLWSRQMSRLSGGQFQRVLLARALMSDPDILILDEPTQGLDHMGINDFYQLIDQVRRDVGCAVLLVSHDLHVVMRSSDRVICLNGHVCCQGIPSDVRNAPEYQALFGVTDSSALALYEHHHDHSHDENGCCND